MTINVLRRLWTYSNPMFWGWIWKSTRKEEGLLFAVWIVSVLSAVVSLILGGIVYLAWVWPPSMLAELTFLVGLWLGARGL